MNKKYWTLVLVFCLGTALVGCSGAAGGQPNSHESAATLGADWVLSEGHWETYTTDDGLAGNRIKVLAIDPDGRLWVGTDQGGGRFDGVSWETVVDWPIPLRDITFDNRGRAWLADGRGVEVYDDGEIVITYGGFDGGVSSLLIDAILMDSQDRLWAGLASGGDGNSGGMMVDYGVDLLEGEQWRHFGTGEGLFSPTVYDLAEDASGNIWAVGEGGVARFNGTTWDAMLLPDQTARQVIARVEAHPSGQVWFGTKDLGLWIWDGEEWTQYTTEDGLAGDTVWAIAFDGAGRAWIGTNGGLSILDGETWTTHTTEDGLVHDDVRALAFTDDGVWIGTWDGLSHLVFESETE
ncbi:MAG: two-component regulator propeller domain-containing protein [Anaerolineae bacterium]